ncbi:Verru_Chthon cassette protein C [Terrimicrobium sacchariphilum]|uniref:Verru_Chthon cassette protein C n=1 Tax=Terrimicrobium sacchariphilum TaxID=690879 RepID=A0A146G5G4_TERSA|nr:Verru_Chthon cassette protein C [Terrimicrobium sacchariphilum]GAT32643.1 Verru_Chthon cassette protein C [Terrimicrobium sacchariphilum]
MAIPKNRRAAFSLLEVLVAIAVLSLILALTLDMTSQASKVWRRGKSHEETFRAARDAFATITRELSQSTLNTYYDYFDASGRPAGDPSYDGNPTRYGRQSELRFACGPGLVPAQIGHAVFFQAPLGHSDSSSLTKLASLLNTRGYYVKFGNDTSGDFIGGKPAFLAAGHPRFRYRLLSIEQPSEKMSVYASPSNWITNALSNGSARVLAENVVAFAVRPMWPDGASTSYSYDSGVSWAGNSGNQPREMNQLPPRLEVILVVIDEATSARLQGNSSAAPDLGFEPNEVFHDPAEWDNDLKKVERGLQDGRIPYRVFRTTVPVGTSLWNSQT